MVGTFQKPSCGRRTTPIHSIPYSVAQPLERGFKNYYSIIQGEPQSYIIDSDEAPGLVTARDPESGEEFVIFDGGRHGYDNMFCDEHDPSELEHRPLKRYEIPASKLVLELGYSIDYEDEKEDFEPDEADTVGLINGECMPWEQVKRDGIDYIALYYVNEKGKPVQILDAELA